MLHYASIIQMNDFTKDELEQLLFDLDAKIFRYGEVNIHEFSLKLRNKIQSLVDNYCEHDFYMEAANKSILARCNKCHKSETKLEFE